VGAILSAGRSAIQFHDPQELDFGAREVVLRASLRELDEDQCVWTPVRFIRDGPRHPRVGEYVYLIDGEGQGCLGEVIELKGWMARVRPRLDA
jgi:hypothetical protein